MVLGHVSKANEGGIPYKQQLCCYRHSPGSGRLVVEVISDEPTRLLRIRDRERKVCGCVCVLALHFSIFVCV